MNAWLQIQVRVEEAVLSLGILAIAGLMIANVLTRSFLGFSLTFAEELSQFLIVTVCFLGLSHAAAQRRHIRMTAFSEQLSPSARRRIGVLVAGSTSLLLLLLAVLALQYVWIMAGLGSVSPVLGVPLFIVYLVAPIGFVLSAIQYLGEALRLHLGLPLAGDADEPSEPEESEARRRAP